MEQAPASLASKEEDFRGTHRGFSCPSLSFKPDMFADRWTAWLKHFDDHIWCPQSINHTLPQPTVANSTPSFLPAHDLLLCQSLGGPQNTDLPVASVLHPLQGFSGRGFSRSDSSGSGLGSLQFTGLTSARGCGSCPALATEGRSQSCLFRTCFLPSVFDLTTEGLFGEAWLVWARQPRDWSLNKLPS